MFLLRDGGNSKEVVSVELDEGAKGLGGSWVDSDLIKRLGLRVRPCRDIVRFGSRLFPELEYIPVEEVDLRLEFCPAGVSVTLPCFVLPPSRAGIERKSDVIIGDYHLMTYGIRELMQLREPVFKPRFEIPRENAWESRESQVPADFLGNDHFPDPKRSPYAMIMTLK